MGLSLAIVMLGTLASAQMSTTDAKPQQTEIVQPQPVPTSIPGDLPALPEGKSTVIGGTIQGVDPVVDQLTLKVFGGRPMKILFDERTKVFRDGAKTSLHDLRTNDHASVETMLDGTTVFARSIHMLSKSPEGECQGQVMSYDSATQELTVSESLSNEPIKLHVAAGTSITREGQAASASGHAGVPDLVKGTLITARFTPNNKGEGIVSQLAILATPGSDFSFTGNVTFLDMRAKQLVVADAQSGESYKISFDPAALPVTRDLHEGTSVRVTAGFDGTRYMASAITLN
jgi:hypothetical protein